VTYLSWQYTLVIHASFILLLKLIIISRWLRLGIQIPTNSGMILFCWMTNDLETYVEHSPVAL
jgi:hypothetical protein